MSKALFLLASALSLAGAWQPTHWSPPGPGDVRSPCPGLNTLANHGALPHNGKDLTVELLTRVLNESYNLDPTLGASLATAGLTTSPKPNATSFDLDNLDKHNALEFDCSMSRHDFYDNGDDHTYVQSLFDTVLAAYEGKTHTDIESTGKGRYGRVLEEHRTDRNITYGPGQYMGGMGAASLFLSILGDPINGVVPVEFVKIFFAEERLPTWLGWHTPAAQTNMNSLGAMVSVMANSSGEPVPSNLTVKNTMLAGDDAPADVQDLLDPHGLAAML